MRRRGMKKMRHEHRNDKVNQKAKEQAYREARETIRLLRESIVRPGVRK